MSNDSFVIITQPVVGDLKKTVDRFTIQDFSQVISTTSIKVLNDNDMRNYVMIQNMSSFKIWIDFNVPAQQGFPSLELGPRQSFEMGAAGVSTDSVYAIGETNSQNLVIKQG